MVIFPAKLERSLCWRFCQFVYGIEGSSDALFPFSQWICHNLGSSSFKPLHRNLIMSCIGKSKTGELGNGARFLPKISLKNQSWSCLPRDKTVRAPADRFKNMSRRMFTWFCIIFSRAFLCIINGEKEERNAKHWLRGMHGRFTNQTKLDACSSSCGLTARGMEIAFFGAAEEARGDGRPKLWSLEGTVCPWISNKQRI